MELRTIFLRMARRWGLWLHAAKRKDEARQILTAAHKIHPADQRVARCLYRLYFDENDADGAEHTLQAYRQGLRRQGASKADVDRKVSEVLQI